MSKKLIENARKKGDGKGAVRAKRIIDALDRLMGTNDTKDMSEFDKLLFQAETLAEFTLDGEGNPLEMVTIKGSGYGYYYSMSDKKLINIPRSGEYYLISDKPDSLGRLKVYSHYKFVSGVVLLIPKDEIVRIGNN